MGKVILILLSTIIFVTGFTVFGGEQFPIETIRNIPVIDLKSTESFLFDDFVKMDLNKLKENPDRWSTLYPKMNLDRLTLNTISSSTLGNSYKSSNLCDGKVETAWVPKVKGGIGEWVKITIDAYSSLSEVTTTPLNIYTIGVLPGYGKSQKTWLENNRVKKLLVIIHSPPPSSSKENEWVVLRLNFKDENKFQVFEVPDDKTVSNFDPMKKEIWIKIEDVYKGTKYDDTCISEFVAVGGFTN